MNSGLSKRNRGHRVSGMDPIPRLSTQIWSSITRGDVLLRVFFCVLATIIMVIATQAWLPPFSYREGYTPVRDIVASVDFSVPDPGKVERQRENARRDARQVYVNNPQAIKSLQTELLSEITKIIAAENFDEDIQQIWAHFEAPPDTKESTSQDDMIEASREWEASFRVFQAALQGSRKLQFDAAIQKAIAEIDQHGLLEKLEKEEGNQTEILIYPQREWDARERVEVRDVQIAAAKLALADDLQRELTTLEDEIREAERKEARQVYTHHPESLKKLRQKLIADISALKQAKLSENELAAIWKTFLPVDPDEKNTKTDDAETLKKFRQLLSSEPIENLQTVLAGTLGEFERRGLLLDLKPIDEVAEGNREEVIILGRDKHKAPEKVSVADVRLESIKPVIRERLEKQLTSLEIAGRIFTWLENSLPNATTLKYRATNEEESRSAIPQLAARATSWLHNRLPVTLTYDDQRAEEVRDAAANEVIPEDFATLYHAGDDAMAKANRSIDSESMALLSAEYDVQLDDLTTTAMLVRLLAVFGMYLAIYTLCGLFIFYRFPEILVNMRRFSSLLGLTVLTVIVCYLAGRWRVEAIPMLLFGMTVAIAYNQEVALLLTAAIGLIVVLLLGQGLALFVILVAATSTAVLMLRRVRSRVKLVYVGFCAGVVAMLTAVGVNVVAGQPLDQAVLLDAGKFFLWGLMSGFAMTGLLPFIETLFGVLTEISLLELGDVAHPLLQELVRRAPGTYNHSINVASMAEAAAESIGSRGLLLRVGSYFHDIGKMLKPQYFVENQRDDNNRHESLVPAMSTLIIIAHVKDGADLARQHHLPRSIIDFIQQHHGTTLVEYFYERANEDSQANPDGATIDENAFRYPGPKPQTKEAGILMLADAVESASRVLVEPTPSRIESLVEDIAMKRLLDGQLDECGLTLQEVRIVQDSLVKSLIAVYHGRVKYPGQQTA